MILTVNQHIQTSLLTVGQDMIVKKTVSDREIAQDHPATVLEATEANQDIKDQDLEAILDIDLVPDHHLGPGIQRDRDIHGLCRDRSVQKVLDGNLDQDLGHLAQIIHIRQVCMLKLKNQLPRLRHL